MLGLRALSRAYQGVFSRRPRISGQRESCGLMTKHDTRKMASCLLGCACRPLWTIDRNTVLWQALILTFAPVMARPIAIAMPLHSPLPSCTSFLRMPQGPGTARTASQTAAARRRSTCNKSQIESSSAHLSLGQKPSHTESTRSARECQRKPIGGPKP